RAGGGEGCEEGEEAKGVKAHDICQSVISGQTRKNPAVHYQKQQTSRTSVSASVDTTLFKYPILEIHH
ncbi:MAG: hypothetical protein U9N12_05720, partial [Euryarchaeota archaeon]|nr:hypothetical protein [Euryarchaeota archaeon]